MTGLKTELLVWRLDRRLRRDVSFGRHRAIRRELRANLADATQRLGEPEAIQQLGDLDDIAAGYRAAAGRGEMSFRGDSGLRAVIWTTLALLTLTLIRIPTFGMVDTSTLQPEESVQPTSSPGRSANKVLRSRRRRARLARRD